MRKTIKGIAIVTAACAAITLGLFTAAWLVVWWLFTGLMLETEADFLNIPMPPIVFSQYTRYGGYDGYLRGYDEDMEYNEYYYHWRKVSFAEQPNYQPVTQENIPEICSFVQDYERQLEDIRGRKDEDAEQLCRRYRYDPEALSQGDYYWVDLWEPKEPYSDYGLCIFDHETNTVYYMSYRQV